MGTRPGRAKPRSLFRGVSKNASTPEPISGAIAPMGARLERRFRSLLPRSRFDRRQNAGQPHLHHQFAGAARVNVKDAAAKPATQSRVGANSTAGRRFVSVTAISISPTAAWNKPAAPANRARHLGVAPFREGNFLVRSLINRFRREDEGAALVEYAILVALIALICVVAVTALGTEISATFSTIASALSAL